MGWLVLEVIRIQLWEGTGDWSQGVLESANWLQKDLLALQFGLVLDFQDLDLAPV